MFRLTTVLGLVLLEVVSSELLNNLEEEHVPVIVQTNYGKVKGFFREKSHANRNGDLYWFNSIPFAEPPVGELRFEPPVPKKKWDGVLDVSDEGSPCVQGSDPVIGSEDCLFLKIQTGKKPNVNNNLPVLVWIYGGAFYSGSADFDSNSPNFLINEDVIIVGIHYRIGLLGFLSTGDLVAPGNNGLRDQILALKWIKENIKNFGGDPNRITIWGQSAGAASVAYLLQTNQTAGLFNQAILNSGSTLSPWALSKHSAAVAAKVAANLNVDTTSSATILDGLKKIGTEELQSAAASVMLSTLITSNPLQGLVYTPVIEPDHSDAVLSEKSHQMLKEGKFHHVPMIIGYTSLEGYFDSLPTVFRLWIGKYDLDYSLLVPEDMNANFLATTLLGLNIKRRYFGLSPIFLTSEKLMRFIADTQMDKPFLESINLYSAHTDVYAYHFSYIGPLYGRSERTVQAVGHTEDLGYLFDLGYEGSDADYLTRYRMVKLWTNFCKYGNPTPVQDPLLNDVIWPANKLVSSIEDIKFLEVDSTLSVTGVPNQSNMLYWDKLYNKYGKPPYSTY